MKTIFVTGRYYIIARFHLKKFISYTVFFFISIFFGLSLFSVQKLEKEMLSSYLKRSIFYRTKTYVCINKFVGSLYLCQIIMIS